MPEITAEAVKKLRDRTGIQMMKCKAALQKADGDMEKAIEILRKENVGAVAKLAEREAGEGRIGSYIDPNKQVGALVELRCETAPVAKSEMFVNLANELAKQVALQGATTPEALLAQPFVDDAKKTVNERLAEVAGLMRENMKPVRMARLSGGLMGSYIHHDGSVGVMVQVEGSKADPQLLRDVCMHITAKSPAAALREHVSQATIDKEMEIARAQAAATGKPANIVEKIAEGKMKTWYAENVLVEQPFVKDDSKTVGDLLKSAGLKLVKFIRLRVGEVGEAG
ncbi:MAG TPA: translation elongation factor Ts [Gemmataceae bacterium]|nr:translation elongation factor Ts [Gemmataceae bacterium]